MSSFENLFSTAFVSQTYGMLADAVSWLAAETGVPACVLGFAAAVLSVVVFFIVRNVVNEAIRKLKKYPPGVFGIPYFGSFFSILFYGEDYFFTRVMPKKGPISMYYVGNSKWAVINDLKLAKKMLNHKNCLNRPKEFAELFESGHDKHIVTDLGFTNNAWAQRRKSMFTAITSIGASGYIEPQLNALLNNVTYKSIENSMDEWYPRQDVRNAAINVIIGALFGEDKFWSRSDEEFLTFSRGLHDLTGYFPKAILARMFVIPNIFGLREAILGAINKVFMQKYAISHSIITDKYTKPAMAKYHEEMKKHGEVKTKLLFDEMYGNVLSGTKDYDQITEDMLTADTWVLFGTATDTTSSTMEYALYVLAQDQELQKELYEELSQCIKPNPADPSKVMFNHEDFMKCVKFRAFLHEAIRLGVAVPKGVGRQPSEKMILKYDMNPKTKECENILFGTVKEVDASAKRQFEYVIDDSFVFEPNLLYMMTVTKKYFGPTTRKFDINRWIKTDKSGKKSFANNANSMSFSHGKRNCVGQLIARKELRILLANLVLNYEMKPKTPIDNISFHVGLARVPEPQIPLVVTKRVH